MIQLTATKRRILRLIPFGIFGTAALIQPVCAAVCPRGKSGCPYPGKCFLYVDGDGNSRCDYTSSLTDSATGGSGTAAQTTISTAGSQPAASIPVTSSVSGQESAVIIPDGTTVPDISPVSAVVPDSGTSNLFDLIHVSPLVAGTILFILFAAVLVWIFRSGITGIHLKTMTGLVATSAFISFGISGILVYLLLGESATGTMFAVPFMIAGTCITAYLWKKGEMKGRLLPLILTLSTLTGFVFLTPLMPLEFTGFITLLTGTTALTPAMIGILIVIGLALIYGRTFCGHICPVGTLQELASRLPGKKIRIQNPTISERIRFIVFIGVIIAGLVSITLMEYTGIYDFFSLTISAGFIVFAIILAISVFVYRPVCRFLCPYGVIFSLANSRSWFAVTRTKNCTGCRKCEKACPVNIAGLDAPKRECYLCGRCQEACPVRDARVYDEQ